MDIPRNQLLKIKQEAKSIIDRLNKTEKKVLVTIYLSNDPISTKNIIEKLKINKSTFSRILKKHNGIVTLIEEVTGRGRGKKFKLNLLGEEVINLLKTGVNGPLGNIDSKSMKIELKNGKKISYFKWSYPLFENSIENPHNKIVVLTGESLSGSFPSMLIGDTNFTCHPFVIGNSYHRTLGCCERNETLIKIEEKIHEIHGIYNQGWSVRYIDPSPLPPGITKVVNNKVRVTKNVNKFIKNKWDYEIDLKEYEKLEEKEKNRKVNYFSGVGAENLLKALRSVKGEKIEIAWVIFTLDFIAYVIHGGTFLEIEAFLPYIPNNKEFITVPWNERIVKTEIPCYELYSINETNIVLGEENLIKCVGAIKGNNLGALELKLQLAEQYKELKKYKDDLRSAWLFKLERGWKFVSDRFDLEDFKKDELFLILKILSPSYILGDIESNFDVISRKKGRYKQESNLILFNTCNSSNDVAVIKSKILL